METGGPPVGVAVDATDEEKARPLVSHGPKTTDGGGWVSKGRRLHLLWEKGVDPVPLCSLPGVRRQPPRTSVPSGSHPHRGQILPEGPRPEPRRRRGSLCKRRQKRNPDPPPRGGRDEKELADDTWSVVRLRLCRSSFRLSQRQEVRLFSTSTLTLVVCLTHDGLPCRVGSRTWV